MICSPAVIIAANKIGAAGRVRFAAPFIEWSEIMETKIANAIDRPSRPFPDAAVLGLTLDYFKPVPWLPRHVQYPVGLAVLVISLRVLVFLPAKFGRA